MVIFPTGRQKRNEFFNVRAGLQKKKYEKYCASVRADKSTFFKLLLLLLLLLNAFPNLHLIALFITRTY